MDNALTTAALPDPSALIAVPPVIRPMRTSDRAAFAAFLRGLSRDDLAARFGRPIDPTSPIVERFLFGSGDATHEVLGAFSPHGELLGSAMLGSASPGLAEIAALVTATMRSRKIGTALASALVASARQRDFRRVEAYVLPENATARALVTGRGFRLVGFCSGYLRFTLEV